MSKSFKTLKNVLANWAKNLNSIVNKMNNRKPLLIGMNPKDPIKLDIVKVGKSEEYPKDKVLPKYGIYRYL